MVRAIIFDCFGVLCTEGWIPFKRKHFSHDPELMEQAQALSIRYNMGNLDVDSFVEQVAKLAIVSKAEVLRATRYNVADDDLFDYIRTDLKPHYKLGILSNAGGNYLRELFSAGQVALFDATSLSYKTGYVKPDRRAYEQAAENLGVKPEQCVFIDDQERYVAAARETGMRAIWYRDLDRLTAELDLVLDQGRSGDPED